MNKRLTIAGPHRVSFPKLIVIAANLILLPLVAAVNGL
jgi:hypothetical protein